MNPRRTVESMRAAGVTEAGAVLVAEIVAWLDTAWPTRESFLRHVNERRPMLRMTKQRLSKELGSRYKPFGPEWNIVEVIIRDSVPAAHQKEVLAGIAGLYCTARGLLRIPGYEGPIEWPSQTPDVDRLIRIGQGEAAAVASGDVSTVRRQLPRDDVPDSSYAVTSSESDDMRWRGSDDAMSPSIDDMITAVARPELIYDPAEPTVRHDRHPRRGRTPRRLRHPSARKGVLAIAGGGILIAVTIPILAAMQATPAAMGFLGGVGACLSICAIILAVSHAPVHAAEPDNASTARTAVPPDGSHGPATYYRIRPRPAATDVRATSDLSGPAPTPWPADPALNETMARYAWPLDAIDNPWSPTRIRYLTISGLSSDAAFLAGQISEDAPDPYDRAYAEALHVVALINLGRLAESKEAQDHALDLIRTRPEPHLHGQVRATGAIIASQLGDMEQVVDHLSQCAKALAAASTSSYDSAHSWHDLAQAYSYSGFHKLAVRAIDRSRRIGAACGVPGELFATPGIPLRLATWQDQHGDTETCTRILGSIVNDLGRLQHRGTLSRLRPSAVLTYGYAGARLAALGVPTTVDITPLLTTSAATLRGRDFAALADICIAIRSGRTTEAIDKIETAEISPDTAGRGEIARLRALALQRAQDPRRP